MRWLFLLSIIPLQSLAAIDLVFIEIRDPHGQVQQLEPKGRFSHIAISYQDQWLHSHPYRGVELVNLSELEKMGAVEFVHLKISALETNDIKDYLGKPYDRHFSWEDDSIYCSELVAKILKIDPLPMKFQAPLWKSLNPQHQLGLSPDDIYKIVLQTPFNGRVRGPACYDL